MNHWISKYIKSHSDKCHKDQMDEADCQSISSNSFAKYTLLLEAGGTFSCLENLLDHKT